MDELEEIQEKEVHGKEEISLSPYQRYSAAIDCLAFLNDEGVPVIIPDAVIADIECYVDQLEERNNNQLRMIMEMEKQMERFQDDGK